MKAIKIKHYRLPVSRTFPTTHPRKGEQTFFVEKINNAIGDTESCDVAVHTSNGVFKIWPKLHTIRSNYELWKKRMDEVQKGEAVIELFYWNGKPYGKGVKQVVFAALDNDCGCGVQRLDATILGWFIDKADSDITTESLANHDGLSLEDFKAWFKALDLSKPLAIIHFTNFRY